MMEEEDGEEMMESPSRFSKFKKGKMSILQVSDSNTKGLSGPEFGDQGNFSKLCRNKMTPSEGGGSAAKGGAFGVGKSVYL
jgi:hypothetical protein